MGGIAYSISGGIQVDSCEVYSDSDFLYNDLTPTVLASLRDKFDYKPIFQNTMFGQYVTALGMPGPNNDLNRIEPKYRLTEGYVIEAQEVKVDTAKTFITTANKAVVALEQLKLLRTYLNTADITIDKVNAIKLRIETVWNELSTCVISTGSLTTGGISSISITVAGFPLNGSYSYSYQPKWGFGTLKTKLVKNG